jgi:hypothetical protein
MSIRYESLLDDAKELFESLNRRDRKRFIHDLDGFRKELASQEAQEQQKQINAVAIRVGKLFKQCFIEKALPRGLNVRNNPSSRHKPSFTPVTKPQFLHEKIRVKFERVPFNIVYTATGIRIQGPHDFKFMKISDDLTVEKFVERLVAGLTVMADDAKSKEILDL